MKKETEIRQSNFELLRIIAMFMIVVTHIINHGQVMQNSEREVLSLIFDYIFCIIIVHVNSYVLVTGYFQSKSKFKMSKVLKTINITWFYRIAMLIFLVLIKAWHPTHIEIFRHVFPLDLGFYWFIDVYIMLYCISPFLNILIEKLDKKEFLRLIIILLIIFSILPTITGLRFFQNNGYTLYNFVLLYFIGAYLREYPIRKSYLFKYVKKNAFQLICIISFLGLAFLNLLLYRFGEQISSYSNILAEIGNNITTTTFFYSNPIIILQSICFFCFFETLDIKSKFINKIASLSLGVYLIHEHIQIRTSLYQLLKINDGPITSYHFIWYIFVIAVLIFVVCLIIEWIRQIIFSFIYNRKISKKIRKKYRNWIEDTGLKINW